MNSTMRRHSPRTCSTAAGTGLPQARGTDTTTTPQTKITSTTAKAQTMQPKQPHPPRSGDNLLCVVALSGFAEGPDRVTIGLTRLYNTSFTVTNQQVGSRRYQRFAGSDAQRTADFQDVAGGRVEIPKVLMGLRGGYGAARILSQIDFASPGARMCERGTLFFGSSDVCAVQLVLLAEDNMVGLAGPMVYSEFGKADPSVFTMDSFICGTTNNINIADVPTIQRADTNVEGTLWGGNLSVFAPLVGAPHMPDIQGGIFFIEDISEQPYRIECMLNTFYLLGALQEQHAIILGDFRAGTVRDVYDSSYDFSAVVNRISRTAKTPVLTGSPFGHITNKTTFPLGARAKARSTGNDGYSVTFSGYPALNLSALMLNNLLPPLVPTCDSIIYRDSVTEEVIE